MSMLTPPGMGGKKYRITGKRYPRMRPPRRRRRIVLASIASATALGLIAWGALQLISVFTGDGEQTVRAGKQSGTADCKPAADKTDQQDQRKPRKLPKPSAITVNVYNATPRSGLAQDTADALEKRGFKIGEVDNAPAEYDKKLKSAGLLLSTPKVEKSGALTVLGAHIAKTETKTDGARKGKAAASVDLMIGSGYKALAKPRDAEKTLAGAASPAPSATARSC